mmetsp:Transcript_40213/g.106696  ORF Transcript_40213/g.106696 Transcript_40213/m.106696 type:complete len:82 (-) Transcript_40213:88-333(-)
MLQRAQLLPWALVQWTTPLQRHDTSVGLQSLWVRLCVQQLQLVRMLQQAQLLHGIPVEPHVSQVQDKHGQQQMPSTPWVCL